MPRRRRRAIMGAWASDHCPSRANPRWTSGSHGLHRHSHGLEDRTQSPGSPLESHIELDIPCGTTDWPLYPAPCSRDTARSRSPHSIPDGIPYLVVSHVSGSGTITKIWGDGDPPRVQAVGPAGHLPTIGGASKADFRLPASALVV